MARHREIWKMTLGGWPAPRGRIRGRDAKPLDVYSTPELLLVKGIITEPVNVGNREVRIVFDRDGNGLDTAHRLIDVLQEWIRSGNG